MIDLHYVPTPNGHKVSILLEELGVEHRIIQYDMLKGEHLTESYRAINPNGRVPALVDHDVGDGEGPLAIMETGAIMIYLADKFGRFLPKTPRARSHVIQWVMWQMAGMGPMHGQAHHFYRYAPEEIPYAKNRYLNEAKRLLHVLDRRLQDSPYVGGSEYTIADMAIWPWVRAIYAIDLDRNDWPAMSKWYDELAERPGVKAGTVRSTAVLNKGAVKVPLTPDQWSNLFGESMHKASGLNIKS